VTWANSNKDPLVCKTLGHRFKYHILQSMRTLLVQQAFRCPHT